MSIIERKPYKNTKYFEMLRFFIHKLNKFRFDFVWIGKLGNFETFIVSVRFQLMNVKSAVCKSDCILKYKYMVYFYVVGNILSNFAPI